jgi:hyperosmotically inducible protein
MSVACKTVLVGFMLATVLGLVACHQERPAEKAGQKIDTATEQAGKQIEKVGDTLSEKSKKAGEFLDDAAITTKIKAEIANDPALKMSQISVETKNGVVRLSGVADSPQSIDRVLEITRTVKNVQFTENGLVVKSAN